jgi:hypothetical protein
MAFYKYPPTASSTLPAGSATAANQTTGNASLSSIDGKTPPLGQALAAASVPMVLTAAQIATLTPLTSITVTPVAALNATGSVTAAGVLFTQDCAQFQSASIHLTSLPAGNTVTFQISNDNVNWYNCAAMPGGDLIGILATTASTVGSYTTQLNSRYFRVNCTTYASGTITVNAYFKNFGNSPNSVGGYLSAVTLDGSGNAITSTSGALDVNIKSDAATIPVTVAGVSTAANQATQIASLASIVTNTGKATLGRALANAPTVTTYGTPITSSAYVTIASSTASLTNLVEIFDSSGVALYFAIGAAGSEVNQFIIYPGGNGQVPLAIPSGSRISYKAVSASASGATSFNVLNLYS